ncbi:alanyl-tRNA editing protein [Halorubrum sp. JWXQ-INN 858]|uniref:alanyl-tRNA editing protein n=1 Tax=Halorubrum sp. JWXQ-INN 858 TaxID=2690782 RepID=UPI00135BA763|nr:alanyl-tRNA editing protein [Halorubrum sp. JWXQ-INN 858]MWV65800.1 alanyl-tRNA editing protein [Halorubrum sp. JWXQ-INN 858]
MTDQLYLVDDARRRFEATVERTLDDRVVLDRTAFYPTGGGQPHDTGVLTVAPADDRDTDGDLPDAAADGSDGTDAGRRWRVVDVAKSDTIYHTLEPVADDGTAAEGDAALPAPGTAVVGEVDWDRRHAHARYHTAQHLLSALLLTEFDALTTGNQLYADHAHLDAAYDRFDADDLARIESGLNDLVDDARPVTSYTMDRAAAEATLDTDRTRIDLLPESITELRIVEVGGADAEEPYDRTACAGTHVSNTAEIGEVVVTGRETKGSDEERVNFVLANHATDGDATID